MLTVWGRATSSNVQKVMWLIGELSLPCQRIDIGGPFGGLDTPDFREMTPLGKIPVLKDDAPEGGPVTIWESNAIARYVASAYGPELFSSDPAQRALVDMWAEWAVQGFIVPVTAVFHLRIRTAAAERDEAALASVHNALIAGAAFANTRLSEHEWLAQPSISLADIVFGSYLYRYFTLPIERPELPALERYYSQLQERAAYRQHVMIGYDSLRAPGA